MKKIFITILILISFQSYSQSLPEKPLESDIALYNQTNLLKLTLGMNKDSVLVYMGDLSTIQYYYKQYTGWGNKVKKVPSDRFISNPYKKDLKYDKVGTPIEILWYYTYNGSDWKSNLTERELLTPIIIENLKLVGMGWGFYEDYSKRKEFTINIK